METWYSVTELASSLKVCRQTIYKLIRSGKLNAVNISVNGVHTWKIHETALFQFMADSYENIKDYKHIIKYDHNDISQDDIPKLKEVISKNIIINDNNCWEWTKKNRKDGYGSIQIIINGRSTSFSVHRLSFFLWNGSLKKDVLHKCHNPKCCNPEHLYEGDDK